MPLRAHLELILRSRLPGIHEWGKVVFQRGIRGKNREDIGIRLVKKFYRVGEGAILAVFVNPQVPDNRREQDRKSVV